MSEAKKILFHSACIILLSCISASCSNMVGGGFDPRSFILLPGNTTGHRFVINNGSTYTYSINLSIDISAPGMNEMRFSTDLSTWSDWEPYSTRKTLAVENNTGIKSVYGEFRNHGVGKSIRLFDEIIYIDRITASDPAENSRLGQVSISGDGLTIIAGAYNHEGESHMRAGSVYIYTWNDSRWQEAVIMPLDGKNGDLFGYSVSISSDGNSVLVGSPGSDSAEKTDSGSAYLYKKNGGAWSLSYIFSAADASQNDCFGCSVSISGNGSVAVIGSFRHDSAGIEDSGKVYVYAWNGTGWNEAVLSAGDGKAWDMFGASVAVSSDGNRVLVGVPGDDFSNNEIDQYGSAYLFSCTASGWVLEKKFLPSTYDPYSDNAPSFGSSVSLSSDGSVAAIGARGSDSQNREDCGQVYVFRKNGSLWNESILLSGDATRSDNFGISVSVSPNGNSIAVGSFLSESTGKKDTGAVYLFRWNGSGYEEEKFTAPDSRDGDGLGLSVSISSGGTIAAGALFADVNFRDQGSVYIFR